jgi:hypothetical protein
MKLQERLEKLLNQDILITLLATDDKDYNLDTRGKLKEVGEDYFVIDKLSDDDEKYIGEELFLLNGILNISKYRD